MIARKAIGDDVEGIYGIEQRSFSRPWSKDVIKRELEDNEFALYYVLETADGLLGAYAGLWNVVGEGQITNIAVLPEFQGQGYGEMLVRILMEAAWDAGCETIFLEARSSNSVALALYRKLGYQTVSIRKAYYTDPIEDACIMECKKEAYCWSIK
ncbi:ribosomal-protein-alanine N-acetyltransferase [Megasphaera hutchinsoni]|uniref:[Ribosomal protein bS18]-alanine N-acetyltransferase n=1 Tax=Megasphaera hutchinsoni TaxID=1588748 RepID=A0A2J8B7E2_9FIRM|nr:ribosomal protein S18-alanine N-acetyltransferase [Megasphaera genomosp. type_2]PNH20692.1 ribosomal-protein-alanine N-acetyltransferase [Megasphaera genomosp. type_2]